MNFKNVFLLSAALGITCIGLGYLVSPETMYSLYGLNIGSTNEFNMVRGAYGGLFLAFGVLFALGTRFDQLSISSLVSLLTFMSGFALGRVVSMIVDGIPDLLIVGLTLFEISYSAICIYLLKKEFQ